MDTPTRGHRHGRPDTIRIVPRLQTHHYHYHRSHCSQTCQDDRVRRRGLPSQGCGGLQAGNRQQNTTITSHTFHQHHIRRRCIHTICHRGLVRVSVVQRAIPRIRLRPRQGQQRHQADGEASSRRQRGRASHWIDGGPRHEHPHEGDVRRPLREARPPLRRRAFGPAHSQVEPTVRHFPTPANGVYPGHTALPADWMGWRRTR